MITNRTIRYDDFVEYRVERDEILIWARIVHFGRTASHRAGGYAFVSAAKEQERQAKFAANPHEQIVEMMVTA